MEVPPSAAMPAWWLDAHLDLAYLDLMGPSIDCEAPDPALRGVSLPALRRGDVRIALATIFTELGTESAHMPWGYRDSGDLEGAYAAGVRQLHRYQALERQHAIRIVRSAADLHAHIAETAAHAARAPVASAPAAASAAATVAATAATAAPPLGVVLLMEGADPIRRPEELVWWHAQGVRVIGLTWARGSRYAGGNATHGPLTPLGRAFVSAMDALGILHDASHLSAQAFEDLCSATDRRIVATHSNAAALLGPSERHLTDQQARVIAQRDGMIGLNLYGRFLASGRPATIDDATAHVAHLAAIVGRDRVGLGSDFDGGFAPSDSPEGCQRPEELGALTRALAHAGWSPTECAGFMHGNWMRVLGAALG